MKTNIYIIVTLITFVVRCCKTESYSDYAYSIRLEVVVSLEGKLPGSKFRKRKS